MSTFRPENTAEIVHFKFKNNAQTTSEQLQTNFKKPQKTAFFALEMVKITPFKGQILT